MTLAVASPVVTFTGTGAVNSYAFPFPVFLQTHLTVVVYSPSAPTTPISLNLGTDFTVSGLSATGAPAQAGSITLVNSSQQWLTSGFLTTSWQLSITRVVPLEQLSSIRNQGDFNRAFLENALDYLMMAVQQINQEVAAPVVPTNYTFPGDITITGAGYGLVVKDAITGFTYRIYVENGVLSTLRLT